MSQLDRLFGLHGRQVLLTGASSGIGAETAQVLASLGANLILSGRDMVKLSEVESLILAGNPSCKIGIVVTDLSNVSAGSDIVDQLVEPVDAFVHCAGLVELAPIKFIQQKKTESMFQVNYHAAVQLTQALVKQNKIKNSGSIIYVSSIAGLDAAIRGNAIYSGTKAALMATARVFALELAAKKIRVNCIAPGTVRTPLFERVAALHDQDAVKQDEINYPLGYGQPEDVAATIAYMISNSSRWMTGSTLVIDGGYTAQ